MDLRQRSALAQASRYSFTRASVAARLRLSSSVQRTQLDSSAEARRCASIQPMPRPQSFRSSISRRHSLWVAGTAPGSASRLLKMTARFFRLPHASSPNTNGCVSTDASLRSSTSAGSFLRKWSIQTDVSTSALIWSRSAVWELRAASVRPRQERPAAFPPRVR